MITVGFNDLEEIFLNHTHYDIFKFYIPYLKIDTSIISPLRSDDDNPSFSVFRAGNKLLFHDFKLGESGDVFKFVRLKYGLSFREALIKIKNDLKGVKSNHKPLDLRTEKSKILYKVRKANKTDKDFWTDYFSIKTVKKLLIYPTSHVFFNGQPVEFEGFVFKVGSRSKFYNPYGVEGFPKYFGDTNKNSIQGWHLLNPNIKKLKLVSSLKEIGVLYEQGIQSIAPNSESTILTPKTINFLKSHWDLSLLYDWDKAGIENANKHSSIYGVPVDPLQYRDFDVKDISDFRKKYGFNFTKEILR